MRSHGGWQGELLRDLNEMDMEDNGIEMEGTTRSGSSLRENDAEDRVEAIPQQARACLKCYLFLQRKARSQIARQAQKRREEFCVEVETRIPSKTGKGFQMITCETSVGRKKPD